MKTRLSLLGGVSFACLCAGMALSSAAQETPVAVTESDDPILRAETVVVQGEIAYRNRSEETVQTLEYGQDYFQRFEPLTAGDALKRVPSVTFLSDVIESDGARLRGLDPGYTQILINGEKVPGSSADRSFFLDRIPAELIDRVEIVRSSSARRSGDAMAGTLNIVLRDGYELDGGYVRAGGLYFDDGELKESLGGVYGGELGPGRILLGANLQGRYNPKIKKSLRYGDSPENNPDFRTDDFDNREDQTDTRDGTDYSFNAEYGVETGSGLDMTFSGFYVKTDRTEMERSFEYDDPTAITGPVRRTVTGNLLTDNENIASIDQQNYALRGVIAQDWSAGTTKVKLGFANFEEDVYETEDEIDFDRATPRYTGDLTLTSLEDKETSAEATHKFDFGSGAVEFGVFFQDKSRDTDIRTQRNRFNVPVTVRDNWNQFQNNPNEPRIAWNALDPVPGGLNELSEERLDLFAVIDGDAGPLAWEAGLRYETTDVSIRDFTVAPADQNQSTKYEFLLPSAHLKYDLTSVDRISASVARTVRRPNFNFITPALLEAELGDNDLLGNPELKPESAWGLDVGYERRLGRQGVFGVNVFYRDVSDLIEIANTGVEGAEGPGTFVLQPRNTGDGSVYGIEFDLSTPLTFAGLPNTGVFANYSWLDSDIDDALGSRRFNDQSEFVYNFGFIHDLVDLGAAFGATYRKQGDAFGRIVGEEITTSYGADLEIFVEKSFGERFTLRAVGSNLLNASKDEVFNKFTTIQDQIDRSFDEYELESEEAGPVFQIMARYAF
ncbi:TonB-dependent receptor plug domain-containing protein [Hyphomonas sp.]|uniref:TonB-dependent receptor plug domain-containing protein n=1 Tax=Hyphomonas sp. TaxID=87 RepID=UPI003919DADE